MIVFKSKLFLVQYALTRNNANVVQRYHIRDKYSKFNQSLIIITAQFYFRVYSLRQNVTSEIAEETSNTTTIMSFSVSFSFLFYSGI